MKNDNWDMILYEIIQADNVEAVEEEAEAISFIAGGVHTLICC